MALARLAVFVSGEGTNFAAVRAATIDEEMAAEVALVVADRPCPALVRAEEWHIPRLLVDRRFVDAPEADREIAAALSGAGITHLVLAGYLRRLGELSLRPFEGRALNLHPSLLPAFPGLRAVERAIEHGVKVTGVTVHLVDEGVDLGPIVWQEPLPIRSGETAESLRARLRPLEHRALIVATRWMVEGRIRQRGRITWIEEVDEA